MNCIAKTAENCERFGYACAAHSACSAVKKEKLKVKQYNSEQQVWWRTHFKLISLQRFSSLTRNAGRGEGRNAATKTQKQWDTETTDLHG